MPFITIEGENKIALQQGNAQLLNVTHFVLANIAGLGVEPADRIESIPAPGDIVDTQPVSKSGYVNTNQVVYSLSLDSTIGDYTFNWVGIKDADDVLIACAYLAAPVTKTATNGGTDGNNLVRNFLLQYSGIQATTAINAPADTWQIDFTTRLLQIDERERLSNLDLYGPGAFFAGGFDVSLNGGTLYDISPGIGYVGGIRCEFTSVQQVNISPLPSSVWVNASLQGDINGVDAVVALYVSTTPLVDYTDANGFKHFVTKIADISAGGVVTDTKVSAALVDDHESKQDPHPQYLRESDTVSQNEAQAGVATIVRAWTALRVKQAIQALVQAATESVPGIVEKATQDEVDGGQDGARFITPLTLKNTPIGLGDGQSWLDVSASRAANITYTNNSGRPIAVIVKCAAGSDVEIGLYIDAVFMRNDVGSNTTSGGLTLMGIVPNGSTYRATSAPSAVSLWYELR